MQAVVGSAMHCYTAMLRVACQVAHPPADESWRPLQEGVFGAFATYCSCATALMAQLRQGGEAGLQELQLPDDEPRCVQL